jgi:hypothetical protein
LRLSIGLEDEAELWADIERLLAAFVSAAMKSSEGLQLAAGNG